MPDTTNWKNAYAHLAVQLLARHLIGREELAERLATLPMSWTEAAATSDERNPSALAERAASPGAGEVWLERTNTTLILKELSCNHHRAAGPSHRNICFAVLTGNGVPSKARRRFRPARAERLHAHNLANACGLLPAELDVITDRLVASGKIERNVERRRRELFTSSARRLLLGRLRVAHRGAVASESARPLQYKTHHFTNPRLASEVARPVSSSPLAGAVFISDDDDGTIR